MEFQFSDKVNSFKPGIFAALNEKKEERMRKGLPVYNLSIGTPDFKPAPYVMKAMEEACKDPENYKYSLEELPELIEAMQNRYQTRYGVKLEADEIMSVYGSQEGMAHIGMVFCNPGDTMLVPDPGYPMFEMCGIMANANVVPYRLNPEKGFLPDLEEIPDEILKETKFMIVSYPLNPVCVCAPDSFMKN